MEMCKRCKMCTEHDNLIVCIFCKFFWIFWILFLNLRPGHCNSKLAMVCGNVSCWSKIILSRNLYLVNKIDKSIISARDRHGFHFHHAPIRALCRLLDPFNKQEWWWKWRCQRFTQPNQPPHSILSLPAAPYIQLAAAAAVMVISRICICLHILKKNSGF